METENDYVDVRDLLDSYDKRECEKCGRVFYMEITDITPMWVSENICRECSTDRINSLKKKAEEYLEENNL